MNIDPGVAAAAGRHFVTAAATATAVLVGVGMMSQDNATATIEAVKQITHGVQEIIVAAGVVASSGMAVWASFKASPLSKMLSVAKRPDVQAIVTTTQAAADAVPSDKVVSPEAITQGAAP